jgi:hypothetical protein
VLFQASLHGVRPEPVLTNDRSFIAKKGADQRLLVQSGAPTWVVLLRASVAWVGVYFPGHWQCVRRMHVLYGVVQPERLAKPAKVKSSAVFWSFPIG